MTDQNGTPPPSSPSPPSQEGPKYLRIAQDFRTFFDLVFPPLVAMVALGLLLAIVFVPSLREDTSLLGSLGAILIAAAGYGLKRSTK